MLFRAGEAEKAGSPDDQSSLLNVDQDEKELPHSRTSQIGDVRHRDVRLNLIDAPGMPHFVGCVIGSLRAAETAIVTVNAVAGIEVNTRRSCQHASTRPLARFIALNIGDEGGFILPELTGSSRARVGPACVLVHVPVGQEHR